MQQPKSARGPRAAILSGSEESSRRASAHSSKAEKHLVATAGKVGRAFPCPGDLGPSALCICLVSTWRMQALMCKWGWDTGRTEPWAEALNSRLMWGAPGSAATSSLALSRPVIT